MNVVELNITGSCKLTLTNYGESAHKDVCLEYVEHSPDAYFSDRDTSIDLDATKAAEIIGFLYKAFPELVTAPAEPAAPAQQEPDAIVTSLTSVPDGVLRSGLDRELPLMAGVYLSPQTPAAPAAWQPIETAPMNGEKFWGYKNGKQAVACRIPRDDCEMWEFGGSSAAVDIAPDLKPTHWMPLPPAPEAAYSGTKGNS